MTKTNTQTKPVQNFAIIGAGMAGITCARTLMQAGHRVTVFEKSKGASGRLSTRSSSFGSFDHGAQYFTVRDSRFAQALATTPNICKPWSANAVRVLDAMGRLVEAARNTQDKHWVATPGMNALVKAWAQPLVQNDTIHFESKVFKIERDTLQPELWQLHSEEPEGAQSVFSGFDQVLLAVPSDQAIDLLRNSGIKMEQAAALNKVQVAPCWTLMVAFPNAVQPGLITLGPQWNAARSVHHRVAWLARESSKPVPLGHKSIWKMRLSVCKPSCSKPFQKSRAFAPRRRTLTSTVGAMPKPCSLWVPPTCTAPNKALACAATGALATA